MFSFTARFSFSTHAWRYSDFTGYIVLPASYTKIQDNIVGIIRNNTILNLFQRFLKDFKCLFVSCFCDKKCKHTLYYFVLFPYIILNSNFITRDWLHHLIRKYYHYKRCILEIRFVSLPSYTLHDKMVLYEKHLFFVSLFYCLAI